MTGPTPHERGSGGHPSAQDESRWWAAIVQQSDDAIIGKSLSGEITSWNRGAERIYGYAASEAVGRHISMLAVPGDEREFDEIMRSVAGDTVVRRDGVRKTRDGRLVSVALTVSPIHDTDGRIVGAATVARDITEQRRLEARLRLGEQRWQAIFSAGRLGVGVRDREARLVDCNPRYAEIFGRQAAELIGTMPEEIMTDAGAGEVKEILVRARAGGHPPGDIEQTFTLRSGRVARLRISLFTLTAADGEPAYQMVLVDDRTAQAQAERELERVRRQDATGQLAGGVAHELNNKLAVVLGYTDLAAKRVPRHAPIQADLEPIREAAEQAVALIKDLLAVGRRQMLVREPLPAAEIVAGLERLLSTVLGDGCELVIDDASGGALVLCDRARLEHVIVNLVFNARDAMPDGGRMTIRTAHADASADDGPQGRVIVSLTDTGIGMSDQTRDRAFEPFFTTKPFGTNAGLGLSTAAGIIAQFGGTIELDSAPGCGTTVRIELPVHTGD